MTDKKNIYDLVLHEEVDLTPGLCVTRVPGGWLYHSFDALEYSLDGNNRIRTTFVPWVPKGKKNG